MDSTKGASVGWSFLPSHFSLFGSPSRHVIVWRVGGGKFSGRSDWGQSWRVGWRWIGVNSSLTLRADVAIFHCSENLGLVRAWRPGRYEGLFSGSCLDFFFFLALCFV
jgi:hypothetical protein